MTFLVIIQHILNIIYQYIWNLHEIKSTDEKINKSKEFRQVKGENLNSPINVQ